MDVDITSQKLQASSILDNFNSKSVIPEESFLQQKCKLLLVTTMKSYYSRLITYYYELLRIIMKK